MNRMEQTEPIVIAGIELRTSNDLAMDTVPPFWDRVFGEGVVAQVPKRVSDDIFAVYTNIRMPLR